MFLTTTQIKQAIESDDLSITPFTEDNVKQVSYSFTLDAVLKDPNSGQEITIPTDGYTLAPGQFILGKTREIVNLNNKFLCILGTRSSAAQQGIDAIQSSSIAEPDSNTQFTLEISNQNSIPIVLIAGMKIVKGVFARVDLGQTLHFERKI